MKQYLELLKELVDKVDTTDLREDRTKVGTYSVFGRTLEFDLTENKIPLLTTKKVKFQDIIVELIWMYVLGNPDMTYLKEHNVNIWDSWAVYNDTYPKGTIGNLYGKVLLDYEGHNQVQAAIDLLKTHPNTRRALFSTWHPLWVAKEELSFEENVMQGRGSLNSCHGLLTQLYLNDKGELEMSTYTRSNDIFLGCPYNIVAYSVLAHLIARELNTKAVRLVYNIGDAHLYSNAVEKAKIQLEREPYASPSIHIDKDVTALRELVDPKQIKLINYQHHPFLKVPVAV